MDGFSVGLTTWTVDNHSYWDAGRIQEAWLLIGSAQLTLNFKLADKYKPFRQNVLVTIYGSDTRVYPSWPAMKISPGIWATPIGEREGKIQSAQALWICAVVLVYTTGGFVLFPLWIFSTPRSIHIYTAEYHICTWIHSGFWYSFDTSWLGMVLSDAFCIEKQTGIFLNEIHSYIIYILLF